MGEKERAMLAVDPDRIRRYAGWSAYVSAGLAVIGDVALFLFYALEAPRVLATGGASSRVFGPLSDSAGLFSSICMLPLPVALHQLTAQRWRGLSWAAMALGVLGLLTTIIAQMLLVARVISLVVNLPFTLGGLVLLGVWMILANHRGRAEGALSSRLAWLGELTGAALALEGGLAFLLVLVRARERRCARHRRGEAIFSFVVESVAAARDPRALPRHDSHRQVDRSRRSSARHLAWGQWGRRGKWARNSPHRRDHRHCGRGRRGRNSCLRAAALAAGRLGADPRHLVPWRDRHLAPRLQRAGARCPALQSRAGGAWRPRRAGVAPGGRRDLGRIDRRRPRPSHPPPGKRAPQLGIIGPGPLSPSGDIAGD